MLDVWIKLLQNRLLPSISAAENALLEFEVSRGEKGVVMHLGGHSQKLCKIFEHFLDQFAKMGSHVTAEAFAVAKDVVLKSYFNLFTAPDELIK
jgi:secreted Zn-dependent insulinase-like peptidase